VQKHPKSRIHQYYGVTRGCLPQRAGRRTAVWLPLRYPQQSILTIIDGWTVRVYRHFKHASSSYIMPEEV